MSLNVCCHNRLLLWYPGGSSKSLCTSLTPVQTFPPMYCSLSWNNRECWSGSIQPGFALEEQLAWWSGQGTTSCCVVRWSKRPSCCYVKRKLAQEERDGGWLAQCLTRCVGASTQVDGITSKNHIQSIWRYITCAVQIYPLTKIYATKSLTHKAVHL